MDGFHWFLLFSGVRMGHELANAANAVIDKSKYPLWQQELAQCAEPTRQQPN